MRLGGDKEDLLKMFKDQDSLAKMLRKMIDEKVRTLKSLDIYLVTEVNSEDFTVNIKNLNFKQAVFNNVPIMSIGLGNFKGIMKLPSVGDLVIVGFIGIDSNQPIVLGTTFNNRGLYSQAQPVVQIDELLLSSKEKGSYIVIKPTNDIIIRTVDSNGNKKGSIQITPEGEIILNGGLTPIARVGDEVAVVGNTGSGGSPGHTHSINITALISTGSDNVTN
jgi:hypothetical protein